MATIAFMVGGIQTDSKNLWVMQDDGSTISVTASYLIGALNVRVIVQDADGSYYIATSEKKVYKYNSSMVLVTGWGTAGVVTLGDTIYGLAIDSIGYLAVAHDEYDTPDKTVALYDNDGTLVWNKDHQTIIGAAERTNAVAFDSGGAVVGVGSRTGGQPIANRYARADGTLEQAYATAVGGILGGGIYVTSDNDIIAATNSANSTIVIKRTSNDTLVWTTSLSENTVTACMVVDGSSNTYIGCSTAATNTLFRFAEDGTENATYNTGGSHGVGGLDLDANGNLISACTSGTDEDGNLGTIRILDTNFNLLRVYNDISVISGATAVVSGVSFKVSTQAPVGAYKTYSRKLVAFSNNKIKYESAADTFTEIAAATGNIDVTKPLDAFELDEKIFIVNKTNLKVLDFGNYKLQTDDIKDEVAGATSHPLRKVTITGAGGAKMVVDYITATDGAAYIYGTKLNSTAFVDGELVSGTNSDGTVVKFDIKGGTTEVDPDPPHWYDWTVYGGSSTYGTMPAEATIGCNWNGRACLAGNTYYPHQWYMFEQMNPWNLNWVALDAQAPVIGNDADAGETGDLLVALMPYKDDFLIHGCAGSLWYNVGDPASGGSLLELDLTAGILGRDAWCWDKNGNLYILATTGILKIPRGFGAPENLTEDSYPDFIKDLDFNSALHKISIGYDPKRHGIKIYKTTFGDGSNTGWWFSLKLQGLFPESVPTNAAPYCMFYYNSIDPAYTGLLSGCTDGFIRVEDDAQTNDDVGDSDVAINSYVTFGPLKLGKENEEGILNSIVAITTGSRVGTALIDSATLTCKVWTGLASDDIIEYFSLNTSPKIAATISAPGRNRGGGIKRPVRGVYAGIRLENAEVNETWGLEEIIVEGGPSGKVA